MVRRNNSAKLTNRAWRLLRLAVLWAKRGGAFNKQNRALLQIRLHKTLRLIRHSRRRLATPRLPFEREFSFEETPTFRIKTPSLRFLPCINAPLVERDFDDLLLYHQRENEDEDEHENGQWSDKDRKELLECTVGIEEAERSEEEKGIDDKAEEFITRFYEEMKLQRQISAIQYYEMLERSV